MTKITPDHLLRDAIVYVRQSTVVQVTQNLESQRRQYGLTEHARKLRWSDVEVIDDGLGRSGAGVRRPGFEKLLAAICEGRVGAVYRWKPHGWRATDATGTPSWSSVVWSAR
jgi:DNA invertase Pin-like site-specific DNA recombinase